MHYNVVLIKEASSTTSKSLVCVELANTQTITPIYIYIYILLDIRKCIFEKAVDAEIQIALDNGNYLL